MPAWPIHPIVADPAIEIVVPIVAQQEIIAGFAEHLVVPGVAAREIVPGLPIDEVVAVSAAERVVVRAAEQPVVAAAAFQAIGPLGRHTVVVACVAEQRRRLEERAVDHDLVVSRQAENDDVLHVERVKSPTSCAIDLDADLRTIDRPRLNHNHVTFRRAGNHQHGLARIVGVVLQNGRAKLAGGVLGEDFAYRERRLVVVDDGQDGR